MADAAHEHERDAELEVLEPQLQEEPERQPAYAPAGNRAFGQFLGRMGDGILPGGAVHPDVASAIGAARGSGHTLPHAVREQVAPHVGDPLNDVKIHTDSTADALSRSVSARAFTTGTDVFFAAGEYQPSTKEGQALLAHELTHVAQQRGAPTSGPMTVSEPGDQVENEAEAVSRDVVG
ncbi:MAG: DUF4157 domain-containing protein [Solirubrobacteraceae bacterium]|nr:DUF4157 domain-containing protein [Solirubrobacteraceae bacterium]